MKKFATIILATVVSSAVFAQTQLQVATGSPTGTYSRMFKEFQQACKDQIMQIEVPTSGSIDNMDKLLGNEVNAAIVQTDVLFYRARNEDLSNIKTLFSLHPEEVHVITTSVSKLTSGGFAGLGSKPLQFNTVNDLAGQTVAAWGGSTVTAQVIRLQSEINFRVREVANFKEANDLLNKGEVAAFIMVGGQPLADVQSLGSAYKLLSFPEQVIGKLKSVYVPAKLNYSKMGQGGSGIQSVATEALFVTRSYKTPKFVQSLASLRGCFANNVDALAETTGTHKKWSSVKVDNTGKWSYYELPTASSGKK